jgi:CheY-like chemotaxis protein
MDGSKNVLIVEDDVVIRDLYRTVLVGAKYNVETAGSAEELYQKLSAFTPDFIFLDVMLPNTSGLDILNKLRTNPAYRSEKAKIVMLTNLAQKSVVDNAMQNGADGYIIKADILPRDLTKVIASLEEDEPEAPAAPPAQAA